MSRTLCSLGFVGLTLAIVALSGEATPASSHAELQEDDGSAVSDRTGQGAYRIIRTAQKPRKKAPPKKGAVAEPAEKTTKPEAAAKPGATTEGGLTFARDIAPIIVGNCIGCHNEKAATKNGKLDLTSFETLKKGGADGAIVEPGKPDESHLYRRLTGDDTPRMPRGANRQLSDAAIEKVGEWIKAGARLEAGIDPKAPLVSYATTQDQLRKTEMAKLSNQEREKLAESKGLERWKKASSKGKPEAVPSKSFVLIGMLPRERANATLKSLETHYGQIRTLIAKTPATEGLEKVGIYVFNERPHFVEFVRSQENRDVERTEIGTANLSVEGPYVAVLDPGGGQPEQPAPRKKARSKKRQDASAGGERTLAGVITEQLATGLVKAESGKAPPWVSLGLGAYFGSRVDPLSQYTQRLRRTAFEQYRYGWNSKANEALGGEAKPDTVRAVGFGMIQALATNQESQPYLGTFLKSMLRGTEKLDDALNEVYGRSREEFLEATGEFVSEHYGR
jgi:mono/diheme cytochrome c family protein